MGNSFVTKIGPPQCKHEFLNEYNDRYFDRVQARNSTQPSKKRWNCMMWKRAAEGVDKEEGQEWPLPRPQLTMTVSTLSTNSTAPPSCMSSPTSTVIPEEDKEDELDLSFESTWEPLHTSAVRLFPSATTSNDSPFSSSSSPPTRSYPAPQGRIQTNSTTEDWQVKQKGDALQLGLSKNRFLQLAATANDTLPRDIQPKGDITAVAFSRSNGSEVSSYLAYSTEDCSLTIMTTKDLKAIFVSGKNADAAYTQTAMKAPDLTCLLHAENRVCKIVTNPGILFLQQLLGSWW
jgi:hypothetical protein